ncbi:MAG: alpha/beta fold hydrolase [Steroidobacteraceae bacterium]
MKIQVTLRTLLSGLAAAALLAACASGPRVPAPPPIVFVHGNGDTAGLWITTIWRFESNGWPRERLYAVDVPYPNARDADDVAQPGRTSTTEHMRYLSAEIDSVLERTGARQVVLFGNSRGGNAIRNYIATPAEEGGGAAKVSHAILSGTPNHGGWADPAIRPHNEFNGSGPFLTRLNHQGDGSAEVTPGVEWLTIRSDQNDKYAQPDGAWIGAKGKPTHVTFAGPELRGATNVVIPGIDHRETAFSPQAFAAAYRFITGQEPATLAIAPTARVILDGKVSGLGLNNDPATGAFESNLPLVGGLLEVFATNPTTGERIGASVHRKTIGADGRWGPFRAAGHTAYEFVVTAPGYAVTHIYRSPFPRSSDIVNLQAECLTDADRALTSVVTLTRPRGYFGVPRDRISLDGESPPPGIPSGVAGVSTVRLAVPGAPGRSVVGEFNGERIAGRAWPSAENHIVFLELHY